MESKLDYICVHCGKAYARHFHRGRCANDGAMATTTFKPKIEKELSKPQKNIPHTEFIIAFANGEEVEARHLRKFEWFKIDDLIQLANLIEDKGGQFPEIQFRLKPKVQVIGCLSIHHQGEVFTASKIVNGKPNVRFTINTATNEIISVEKI